MSYFYLFRNIYIFSWLIFFFGVLFPNKSVCNLFDSSLFLSEIYNVDGTALNIKLIENKDNGRVNSRYNRPHQQKPGRNTGQNG